MSQSGSNTSGGGGGGTINEVLGTPNQVLSSNPAGPSTTLSLDTVLIAPGSIASTTTIESGTNYIMPDTTSSVGQIIQNGFPLFHTYGTFNVFLGENAGNFTLTVPSSVDNMGFGVNSLQSLTTGSENSCFGISTGADITTGVQNSIYGASAGQSLVGGNTNCAYGYLALAASVSGSFSTAIGANCLTNALGSYNTAIGNAAGGSYTGTEASNVLVANAGTLGESNTMRLGTPGSGNGQVNRAFIAGVTGVTPAATYNVAVVDTAGQMGELAIVNRAVLTSNATGVPAMTALATNGQLIIGSTAGAPAAATLTAGNNTTITNGSNSITVGTTVSNPLITQVVVQTFTSSGTYTPTSGMRFCTIECVGGGGGGGGCAASSTNPAAGAGGGGGGYSRRTVTAATVGASQTVTIGAAGAAGTAGANAGGTGGTTSVGALISATGGTGGAGGVAGTTGGFQQGLGGTGSTGDINIAGGPGSPALYLSGAIVSSGNGGNSYFGAGAGGKTAGSSSSAGTAGTVGGGGGSGAYQVAVNTNFAGGAGGAGLVIITEFCSA